MPAAANNTWVLRCDDLTVVARKGSGEVAVFLPSAYQVLSQVSFGDVERYKEQETVLTMGPDVISLRYDGQEHPHCINDRKAAIWEDAKLKGVAFRAVGNEPAWVLELGPNDVMHLRLHYGEKTIKAKLPQAVMRQEERFTSYQIEHQGQSIVIEIKGQACSDSMSGDQFKSQVFISVGQDKYRGCGKALY